MTSSATEIDARTTESAATRLRSALTRHAEAAVARTKARLGGPLTASNLTAFLEDRACLRFETRLVFTNDGLEPHQFAQPFFEGGPGSYVCRLHVRPRFAGRTGVLHYLVAYMAAAIDYGDVADADLCEMVGAALVGLSREDYCRALNVLAKEECIGEPR